VFIVALLLANFQIMAHRAASKFGMVLFNFVPLRLGNPAYASCMALVYKLKHNKIRKIGH
jgi:hypothetical protein